MKPIDYLKQKFRPSTVLRSQEKSNADFDQDLARLHATGESSHSLRVLFGLFGKKDCEIKPVGKSGIKLCTVIRSASKTVFHNSSLLTRNPLGQGSGYVSLDVVNYLTITNTLGNTITDTTPLFIEDRFNSKANRNTVIMNKKLAHLITGVVSACTLMAAPIFFSLPLIGLTYYNVNAYLSNLKSDVYATIQLDDATILGYYIWVKYLRNTHAPTTELLSALTYVLATDKQCEPIKLCAKSPTELESFFEAKAQEAISLQTSEKVYQGKDFIHSTLPKEHNPDKPSVRELSLIKHISYTQSVPLAFKIIKNKGQVKDFLAYLEQPRDYLIYEIDDNFFIEHASLAEKFLREQDILTTEPENSSQAYTPVEVPFNNLQLVDATVAEILNERASPGLRV